MRVLGAAAGGIVLAACAAAVGAVSGLVDVAASSPHPRIVRWVLSTTMERSVRRRASEFVPPPSLEERVRSRTGFAAYEDLCVGCHSAPGVEQDVIAKGLNPEAPRLEEVAAGWSDAELFWIVKHGVRMTGMPAFGATHEDRELWDVVAFVRHLPEISAAEYQRLREERGQGDHAHAHSEDRGGTTPQRPAPPHGHEMPH